MRIMGIDYGDARTGVAISDLLCSIVGSAQVVPSRNTDKAVADIVRLARENQVGEIAVGLPRNMDGTEGPRAELCRAFADRLAEGLSAEDLAHFRRCVAIFDRNIEQIRAEKSKRTEIQNP